MESGKKSIGERAQIKWSMKEAVNESKSRQQDDAHVDDADIDHLYNNEEQLDMRKDFDSRHIQRFESEPPKCSNAEIITKLKANKLLMSVAGTSLKYSNYGFKTQNKEQNTSSKLVTKVVPISMSKEAYITHKSWNFYSTIHIAVPRTIRHSISLAQEKETCRFSGLTLTRLEEKSSIHLAFQKVEHNFNEFSDDTIHNLSKLVHKLLSRVLRNIIVIFARTFRVILFSIHNDEWKSFQCHHQTALRTEWSSNPNLLLLNPGSIGHSSRDLGLVGHSDLAS
ncbi:hypothetical protein Tco_1193152 [Tanacetum coccineum]